MSSLKPICFIAFFITLTTCFSLIIASPLHADTFTVTKTDDTADGTCDADCSLRESVAGLAVRRKA